MSFDDRILEMRKRGEAVRKVFGKERFLAVPIYEDVLCYDEQAIAALSRKQTAVEQAAPEDRPALIKEFAAMRDAMEKKPNSPERIYLWPADIKVPTTTEYSDNSEYMFNHDPDFRPYLYEMLLPEDVTPKGAMVLCAGGDHGNTVLTEAYQSAKDLNACGYQCFLLLNRVNHNPWNAIDSGADTARAIRYVRAHAAEYRIPEDRVAFAGFSNGGLTGDNCIQYFSGNQKMTDVYPDYVPDELDKYYGAPDAFVCVYGPRFPGIPFDWTGVVYPPTFFAVGREDNAMDNLHHMEPDLLQHGVKTEVHTFAGVPHGQAGISFVWEQKYPTFEMWVPLADAFMQDVYKNN